MKMDGDMGNKSRDNDLIFGSFLCSTTDMDLITGLIVLLVLVWCNV